MKNFNRIINAVTNQTWLIKQSMLHSIYKQLEMAMSGNVAMPVMSNDDKSNDDNYIVAPSKTVLINVDGIIGKHLSLMETECGGLDLDDINAQLDEALANVEIEKVLIYFNTPGGVSTGVEETANKIKELSKVKEVIGYTDTMCASAGYWLASQCTAFYCAASADVGSINAYCLTMDESLALANAGIKITEFVGSNGKYKTSGASYKPLSDDDKTMFQADINRLESRFINSVLASRTDAKKEDCNGLTYDGETAVMKGLADGIIPTMTDFLTLMGTNA